MQKRGRITPRIQTKAVELLGREITVTELRLIPYVDYELKNNQRLKPIHMNNQELEVLSDWVEQGWIVDGVSSGGRPMLGQGKYLKVTREFYDAIQEIMYLGYVDIDHE